MAWGWIYGAVAAVLALLYGLRELRQRPSLTRTMVKTLSVAALALIALLEGGPILLVLALALSAAGDAFLAAEDQGPPLQAGMAAFAAAHLAYVILFVNQGAGLGYDVFRIVLQMAAVAAAAIAALWLWPSLGAMRGAVGAYMAVIALMTVLALGLPPSLWLVSLGAVLFFASDAILAAELFKLPANAAARVWTPYAVWGLYWSGQAAITAGMLYPNVGG